MRVVLATEWFIYYTVDLANALSEQGCEVLLITRNHSLEIDGENSNSNSLNRFIKKNLNPSIRHSVIDGRFGDIWGSMKSVVKLISEILAFCPDVMHVQQNRDWRIYFLTVLFFRKSIIYTLHDVVPHPGELRKKNSLFTALYMRMARGIVVHGKILFSKTIENFGNSLKKKLYVIPHGMLVSTLEWDDASVREEPGTILFFGRMNRYKGIDVLCRAIRILQERGTYVKLILAGRGHEKLEDLIGIDISTLEAEIHERFIPESEIYRFFRRSSVIVYPYIEASQSGAVTLSFVYKKPMVVTSVGAIPEVIINGVTGLIVPPGDEEALANAIEKLLLDKTLRLRLAHAASEWAEENISWKVVAKRTISLYKSLNQSAG